MLTQDDLKILSKPFDEETIGIKVQSFSKDRTKAMLVAYVQHTDVYARLEQVDPSWTAEVTSSQPAGENYYVRVKLAVKGVARENAGEGGDEKSATSDAIKRAAMLFGVGRYLYDSETVWVNYNEQTDRFKSYTYADYKKALRPGQAPLPTSPAANPAPAPAPVKEKPAAETKGGGKRDALNRAVMNLYRPYLSKFPETNFVELLQRRYGVGETRMMTVEQIEDLIKFMEDGLNDFKGGSAVPKKTRAQLGAEIIKTSRLLNMDDKALREFAHSAYQLGVKELSDHQMAGLLESLLIECGRAGIKAG